MVITNDHESSHTSHYLGCWCKARCQPQEHRKEQQQQRISDDGVGCQLDVHRVIEGSQGGGGGQLGTNENLELRVCCAQLPLDLVDLKLQYSEQKRGVKLI